MIQIVEKINIIKVSVVEYEGYVKEQTQKKCDLKIPAPKSITAPPPSEAPLQVRVVMPARVYLEEGKFTQDRENN
ncbi:18926_t:CDS:2 [Entrophospora sp. SA101]|nr:1793_t:CDS:2 [Entrophospora sp. SA101]CAJ0751211.1 18926_t:CDS:2 [Entrophospora sp. SA101]CAJ0833880.1 10074_t:CDS:2 [Entrophospora sp. SA101]CAJ0844984.1 6890_t:CDS:2 [Entrophospora sp. SA101]